jgi:hypothetical protein
MQIRFWALFIGVVYVIFGVLGFIPALHSAPPANGPHVDVSAANGMLFGLFPVNAVHDAINIVLGFAGIAASPSVTSARYYSRFLALLFGIATALGFVPQADTLSGLAPIWGNDAWAHAVTAIASSYFGWVAGEPTSEEATSPA